MVIVLFEMSIVMVTFERFWRTSQWEVRHNSKVLRLLFPMISTMVILNQEKEGHLYRGELVSIVIFYMLLFTRVNVYNYYKYLIY